MSDPVVEPELSPEETKIEELQKIFDELEQKTRIQQRQIEKEHYSSKEPILRQRNEAINAIPQFWKNLVTRDQDLRQSLSEEDLDIWGFVTDLWIEEDWEGPDDFKMILTLAEGNEYFTNTKIEKSYKYDFEKDEWTIKGTELKWKEGKDLSKQNKDLDAKLEQEGAVFSPDENIVSHWFGYWNSEQDSDDIAEFIRTEVWPAPGRFYASPYEDDDVEEGDE
eukprot:TRINITY_DN21517_c0_g1_i1.p1 TRINITY_DN21517_c0_g1~~TRINITY_DN21517_c0_g1_i1.p1  ORF type:complete len:222 (+),score=67.06 TRINITY_DN21517_c0_g1_i1:44-709(+)